MSERLRYAAWGASAVLCLAIGLGIGWLIWGRPGEPESPQIEQRQADGSLELERGPIVDNVGAIIRPPHEIPRGATEERRVSVVVQPADKACGPLQVNLSVVRSTDGSARVVASSPDGMIVSGIDVPMKIEPMRRFYIPTPRPWAAGISYAGDQAWGIYVQRDVWRLRAGLEVNETRDGGAEARATIGWAW